MTRNEISYSYLFALLSSNTNVGKFLFFSHSYVIKEIVQFFFRVKFEE